MLDAHPAAHPTAESTGHQPALFVPGFTGSKEDFAPVLDPLRRAGCRVIAMDQRGQFESPAGSTPESYGVAALAADVLAVVDDLVEPGQQVHLVGHSFGGLVARSAVLSEPVRFASLTLIASGPGRLRGPRADRLAYLAPLLAYGGLEAVYAALERLGADDPRWAQVPPGIQDFLRRRFLASSPDGLRGMAAAMLSEPDRVDELRSAGVPVLVLHSASDNAWSPAEQTEMARRLGARHVIVSHSVHSPARENPAAVVEALLEFWGIGSVS